MDAGHVIDSMERDAEELAKRIVSCIRDEVEEYRSVRDPALGAQVFAHALAHVNAFVRCARRGRPPQGAELDFVRERGAWRARDLMPLDSLLETYLIGQRLFWETIVGAAGDSREGLLVARELTGFTFQYTHAINVAVAEAYLREARALATEVDRARRDLIERLLAGDSVDPARADAFGIRPEGHHTVVVVMGDERQALRALERLDPFVVVRGDQVIAVSRLTPAELRAQLKLDAGLTAGISTTCHGLPDIARGFAEARCALRHADPVATLEEVGLLDYLAHAADETAQRLFPPGIERLDGLAETLHAYADCDLNVARTAEQLGVHTNTVHYRLRRAHELTGRDPRRFAELVELTTALRLLA